MVIRNLSDFGGSGGSCEITLQSADGSITYVPADGKVSCGGTLDAQVTVPATNVLNGDVVGPDQFNQCVSLNDGKVAVGDSSDTRIKLVTLGGQLLDINSSKTVVGNFTNPASVNASTESIAIGDNAGVLDFSGNPLVQDPNTFYIGPKCIRTAELPHQLYFSPITGEICMGNTAGGGGIQEITSSTLVITDPLGPICNLEVVPALPDGTNYSDYLFWNPNTSSWEVAGDEIHIGTDSGSNQGTGSVALGRFSGATGQSDWCCAIGPYSGWTGQHEHCVSMGFESAYTSQGEYSIAVGSRAGRTSQAASCVAIGRHCGWDSQSANAIAIGGYTGYQSQGIQAIALGHRTGEILQGSDSIAIGFESGRFNQGLKCIAIGFQAGKTSQPANSFYVGKECVREASATKSLFYEPTTGEISYSDSSSAAVAILEAQVAALQAQVVAIESYLSTNLPPGP